MHNPTGNDGRPNSMSLQPARPNPETADQRLRAASLAAAELLEADIETVVTELSGLLQTELPSSIGAAAADTVRERVRAVIKISLAELREGREIDQAGSDAIAKLARRWADHGRPLDHRSIQVGARHVMSLLAAQADALGISDRTLFVMQDQLWAWATICSSILADAQRDHDLRNARRDAARRADFLRNLAAGTVSDERLVRDGEAFGLDLTRPYFAVCADCGEGSQSEALEAHVRRSGSTSDARTLQVVVDSRLLALAPRVPRPFAGVALAVGQQSLLANVHSAFSEAAEALAAARAFGITGVVDLGMLGPLPLVTKADALGERLSTERFRELDERGTNGLEIERTVAILLDLDRNLEATAQQLNLHRNSVRHRVERFHELTGLDIRRTEDFVTIWWLLKHRQAVRAADQRR